MSIFPIIPHLSSPLFSSTQHPPTSWWPTRCLLTRIQGYRSNDMPLETVWKQPCSIYKYVNIYIFSKSVYTRIWRFFLLAISKFIYIQIFFSFRTWTTGRSDAGSRAKRRLAEFRKLGEYQYPKISIDCLSLRLSSFIISEFKGYQQIYTYVISVLFIIGKAGSPTYI